MATNPDFIQTIIADQACCRSNSNSWYDRRMVPEGSTARLILRPLQIADAPQIQEIFPQWEIVRYLLNVVPWPYPPDGAYQHLSEIALPAIERGEQWVWTLRLTSAPNQIIGVINLRTGREDHRGFWLAPSHQRQGLMSEACAWANDYWFDTLGFAVLRVAKSVENTASRRISERQGMRMVGLIEKDYVSGRMASEVWEITAAEWRAWKAREGRSPQSGKPASE
jgi:RimJ/RimL family protein N-acetyltransferase